MSNVENKICCLDARAREDAAPRTRQRLSNARLAELDHVVFRANIMRDLLSAQSVGLSLSRFFLSGHCGLSRLLLASGPWLNVERTLSRTLVVAWCTHNSHPITAVARLHADSREKCGRSAVARARRPSENRTAEISLIRLLTAPVCPPRPTDGFATADVARGRDVDHWPRHTIYT